MIADIKRNIISHLDLLEEDFNKEVDMKYTECSKTLINSKADIKRRYDTITTWRNDMSSLKQYTSNVQLFHVIKFLDAVTHKEETKVRHFKTIPTLNFQPAKQILPLFGTLSVDNSPIPTSTDLDIDQQGQAFVRSEVPKEQIELVTSFETFKIGDNVRISRGCFLPDNRLFLCDLNDNKVYLCDYDESNINTINLDYFPYDVTLFDRNTACITVGDKGIQKIDLNTLKPRKRIKIGSRCYWISSLNDKIWVNSAYHTLSLIDTKGKVQKEVKTSFNPWRICLSKDGDIYCTDNDSDDVYVVTSDGEERVVYSSRDLSFPLGITVDDRGYVYIAGGSSRNIHRISSDGKQSKIILTKDDGINDPCGLSYNHRTKELMVVNNGDRSIKMYKVH